MLLRYIDDVHHLICSSSSMQSSTFGVGQVLKSVLMHADTAPSKIIVCVGGSATNDGGAGLAHALGYEFLDSSGDRFTPT